MLSFLASPFMSNIINILVAIGTIGAVIVALRGIKVGRNQAREDWQHAQQLAQEERIHAQKLAIEERQHQCRPIIVPIGNLSHLMSNGFVDWNAYYDKADQPNTADNHLKNIQRRVEIQNKTSNIAIHQNMVPNTQEFTLQNMGNGIAFNIHAILYGPNSANFASWNNGPIAGNGSLKIVAAHGETGLGKQTKVDGIHWLYNDEDINYRIARITITYSDLFDIKHVSIFDYLLLPSQEYRWVHIATKSRIEKDLEDLDFEKIHSSRRLKPTK